MPQSTKLSARSLSAAVLTAALIFMQVVPPQSVRAQTPTTGSFVGSVTVRGTDLPPEGEIIVVFHNVERGTNYKRAADRSGNFRIDFLPAGDYDITVQVDPTKYKPLPALHRTIYLQPNTVIPVPIQVDPLPAPPPVTPTAPVPENAPTPAPSPAPSPLTPAPSPAPSEEPGENIPIEINRTDGRRSGAFTYNEVVGLPLGSTTLVRTFDELALLLPGVFLPPQTLSRISGPGVGPGIGSAGQFAVNGMPPRANNFLVDGSDNNDEDIGVRRQGYLSLVPQPTESIREYHVITLLAPPEFGRNIGAQVNALSRSGGSATHGTVYGFLSSSNLSSRNFFDTTAGNGVSALRAGNSQNVIVRTAAFNFPAGADPAQPFTVNINRAGVPLFIGSINGTTSATAGSFGPASGTSRPFTVQNNSGGKDSFTLLTPGFVLGGPLRLGTGTPKVDKAFYFVSFEKQVLNASQEASFAVPTLEARGLVTAIGPGQTLIGSGASGVFQNCINSTLNTPPAPNPPPNSSGCFNTSGVQNQTLFGAAIFSLFPLPNNPGGIYGANTFTQNLPASGRGIVLSGKLDYNLTTNNAFTARYNFTEDHRAVPVTGGALFSSLEPHVKTQNLSTYINSQVSTRIGNQLRLSYGRTHINFNELRDQTYLLPSQRRDPFLLNAPLFQNITTATTPGTPFAGDVTLLNFTNLTTENITGPLGQVIVGGYSPIGVDVNNFPQRRTNNTYQLADTMTYRVGNSNYAFGADLRRTELNSFLPANARPQITFLPGLSFQNNPNAGNSLVPSNRFAFFRPEDLVAAGVPSSYTQALSAQDPTIGLRYYQLNFFGQNEWHPRRNLTVSYGARYEYNTPVREMQRRIENAYRSVEQNTNLQFGAVLAFLNGRTQIYDPDRNNIAPRISVAYSPNVNLFGANTSPVFRGGFGVFYDQILGAVVSQSRNVFPLFLPINFASQNFAFRGTGGPNPAPPVTGIPLTSFNPTQLGFARDVLGVCIAALGANTCLQRTNPLASTPIPLIRPGTLNTLNPALGGSNFNNLLLALQNDLPSGFNFTLPARTLEMPMAYHYTYSVDLPLPRNMVASVGYVGTLGRHLLRFNTPNAGPNFFPFINNIGTGQILQATGNTLLPVRPVRESTARTTNQFSSFGPVNQFETIGRSRYDAFQAQLRGRLQNNRFQYQVAYTFSKAFDDVSDVFDLAGAPALPQDFTTLAGEYARSNFDAPHRFSYNFIYDFATRSGGAARTLLNGLQVSGSGQVQSGQPFTVNSLLDVNLDGNPTDRLNTTSGLAVTGNGSQPLQLNSSTPAATRAMLANLFFDGSVPRNSFRAGNVVLLNLAATETFKIHERQSIRFRVEAFNFINRTNFGIPVRYLEAVGFGRATDTVTPNRRFQFALKYEF